MDFGDISQQWVAQNEHLREMSTPIQQVDFTFEKMERCTKTEFNILSFMTETKQHVNKLYKNPQQYSLNRYPAYLTFNPTRVKLDSSPQDETVQNYINANFVEVQGKKVIATQGPLPSTLQTFWKMVDLHNVGKIFMLCNFVERGSPKCERYFPYIQHNNGLMHINEYQLRIVKDDRHKTYDKIKIRQIQLKNNTSKVTKLVTQYQVTDWEDGKAPTTTPGLNWLLRQFLHNIPQNRIPIVHCSAGVGRTGTFIAMAMLQLQIETNQDLSVFEDVRRLREQRWGMVKTLAQYEYLYEFVEQKILSLHNAVTSQSDGSDDQPIIEQTLAQTQ